MLAMTLYAPRARLVPELRADPAPGPGQVLIAVSACGVCRTDLHIVDGELPPLPHPVVPGHEIVGRVLACGPGVDRLKPGGRVGVPWLGWTCGVCEWCRGGQENLCPGSPRFARDDESLFQRQPNHHPTSSTPKDTAPSAAQYHANGSSAHSSCRRNHRISTHVLTNAVTPATTAASTASSNVPAGTASRSSFGTSSTVAPRITGVAIMNEKCAAPAWSSPRSRPPTIVTPDREIPGISARHCQQPIASA